MADLEARQMECAQQQAACNARAAQLQQRSEAVAAEAQAAHDASRVRMAAAVTEV